MRDVSEWAEADLNELIESDVQESMHLDYKQSRALARKDECRSELSKDVAAFANSDGGRIIYGIIEKDQNPQAIDEGVNAREITREWLEQVIYSNIQPKIDGLRIYSIPLPSKGADRVAFVIDIPQSKSRAPHQSRDKRYYKRYNFQSVAMEDYEIRDISRRASTPDLWIRFSFDSGNSTKIATRPGEQQRLP
jgi:predicted HTH transcriptional regulator